MSIKATGLLLKPLSERSINLRETLLSPLINKINVRKLLTLEDTAFSRRALRILAGNNELRRSLLTGNYTAEQLGQAGLKLLQIETPEHQAIKLIVALRDSEESTTIFLGTKEVKKGQAGFKGIKLFSARIPDLSKDSSAQEAVASLSSRPPISPRPLSPITPSFIPGMGDTDIINYVSAALKEGTLVVLIDKPIKNFAERFGKPIIAELLKAGLTQEEAEKRVNEFQHFLFSGNGTSCTEVILNDVERLKELQTLTASGRKVAVASRFYSFLNQWLLSDPARALALPAEQRRILIEAGEVAEHEVGTIRSDGGKLMLVLEELMARERNKYPGLSQGENRAKAFSPLCDRIMPHLELILKELEEKASLPNGFAEVYQAARASFMEQVDFLFAEAKDPQSPYVRIHGTTVVVNMAWRSGANSEAPHILRRAIYEFMEAFNRGKPEKEHLHIAISYDRTKAMGFEYTIGINPNSYLAGEIDLSNLWQQFAAEEDRQRSALGIPTPARNWGGFFAAGGSPVSSRGTLLDLRTILEIIGKLPFIEKVNSGVAMYRKHTLNLPDYLTPRIPEAALAALDNGERVTVELHHGPQEEAEHYLDKMRSQLEQLTTEKTEDGCDRIWYRVKGTNKFIVTSILGETKLMHLRLLLTYAGLTVERIYHYAKPEDYTRAANKLIADTKAKNGGNMPRTVVIGPGGALSRIIASRINGQKILESLQKLGKKGAELLTHLTQIYKKAINERLAEMQANLDYAVYSRNNPKTPERTPDGKEPRKNAYLREIAKNIRLLSYFGIRVVDTTPTITKEAFSGIKDLTPEDLDNIWRELVEKGYITAKGEITPKIYRVGFLEIPSAFKKQVIEILLNSDKAFFEALVQANLANLPTIIAEIKAGLETISTELTERPFVKREKLAAVLAQKPEAVLVSNSLYSTLLDLREAIEEPFEVFSTLKIGGKNPPISFEKKISQENIKSKVENNVYDKTSIVSLPGSEPFLFVTIPFGILCEYLGRAIAEQGGVEQVIFFGNAGFITGSDQREQEIEPGDLFVPTQILGEHEAIGGFSNLALPFARGSGQRVIDFATGGSEDRTGDQSINIVMTTHAGFVITPAQEHDAYVEGLRRRAVSSVELEMGPLTQGLGPQLGQIGVSILGYFSDVPGRENATLSDTSLGGNPRIQLAKETMVSFLLSRFFNGEVNS